SNSKTNYTDKNKLPHHILQWNQELSQNQWNQELSQNLTLSAFASHSPSVSMQLSPIL
ncbi:hypothetical protein ACJX0J_022030, partial [Zea mays]